jgi:hypothetical protein
MGSHPIHVRTVLGALAVVIACEPGRERPVRDPISPVMTSLAHDDWSEPVNVGAPISSTFVDQSPTLSADGLSLYFSSNRPGTVGGNDLWVAHRACSHCPWEAPSNLGPLVNSAGGDAGPSLSLDERMLFFTSNRAGGRGLNDIYVTKRVDRADDLGWETPVLLSSEVSTAEYEHAPNYVQTGGEAGTLYFTRGVSNGVGNDIYRVTVNHDGEPVGAASLVTDLSDPATNDAMTTFRANGKEVIFASDRPPPHVGFHFWTATRRNWHESWSTPVNLATVTPLNAGLGGIHPSMSLDGRTLLFASGRPGTLGGLDIWMSTR